MLLANESDFLREFSENFGSSEIGDAFWYILLLILGFLLLLFTLRRFFHHFFVDREGHHLFNELCAAHKLGKKERRFLHGFAEALNLKNKCLLFVQPKLYDKELTDLLKERWLLSSLNWGPQAFRRMRDKTRNAIFREPGGDGEILRQTDGTDKAAK